ncbi:MAG: hypothetical protein K6G89_07340 [Clostridia bacterium]|nr:hypothetical protein [Clostridia bacterium]
MKKLLAVLLAVSMILSVCLIGSFADEGLALSYDTGVATGVGFWLSQFDGDGNCIGNVDATFNAAAPITGIYLPVIFAGRSADEADAAVRFEIFAFDGDADSSVSAAPLYTEDRNIDGDTLNVEFRFGKALPAGQYIFRIAQITPYAETLNPNAPGPYTALPSGKAAYGPSFVKFGSTKNVLGSEFIFGVFYDGSVAASEFFKAIETSTPSYFIEDLETTIISRVDGGYDPHQIGKDEEFAILTEQVPAGKVIKEFTFKNSPTWSNKNHDSDAGVDVYVWKGDYETTLASSPIFSDELLDHTDNHDMKFDFGAKLKAGRRYLIVITRINDGAIGFWQGTEDSIERDGWEFFVDGDEAELYPACTFRTAEYTGPEDPDDEPDVLLGDADGDGELSDWDAITFERYLAGWSVEIDLDALDLDVDGEVSDWDAIMLARYLAGWDVTFG